MKLIAPAKPIVDDKVLERLRHEAGTHLFSDKNDMSVKNNADTFVDLFSVWVENSKLFPIQGLDVFDYQYVTDGVTGAFHDLYLNNDRVYTLLGEYPYHNSFRNNTKISDPDAIPDGCTLVLSHPFSATGTMHNEFDYIMKVCEKKRVSVMLDMAFFGISKQPLFDLNKYPAIKQVAFSLSKPFATGYLKIGVLYTKQKLKTPLATLNEWTYVNQLSTLIHTKLITTISPDYMFEKYRGRQLSICKKCGLEPSDTVIFGITKFKEYDEYTREGVINRVCLSYELQR